MSSPSLSTILSFEDARHLVETHAAGLRPRGRELLTLLDANGRVLAEPVHADRDFPPFRRATRDGYAMRTADLARVPATLEIVAEVKAGSKEYVGAVASGQVVSVMTGAPVPDGADAVVMVEFAARDHNRVEVTKQIAPGDNIIPVGVEAKRGAQLLATGVRIDFAAIAIAASVGRSRVLVHAKPRVTVLSTGDEIVDVDIPPGPTQIRNSNSYSLAAQIANTGGEPMILPIAPDEPGRLLELLREGLEADLLLIAGGVSMGKYDLVEEELAELKAEFFFTGAHIQPGKPVVFGCIPSPAAADDREKYPVRKYFLGLPGNPISTMVCFELFARPLIEALAGMKPRKLIFTRARLNSDIKTKLGLKRFLPAFLSGEFQECEVELVSWQGSGDIAAMSRSNCYVVVPPDRERIPAGEWMPVLLR